MERGPHLSAAVFCETVIEAKDNTISLIRIIDTVTQTATGPEPPAQMPAFLISTKLVISLKADQARGRYAIKVRPEAPDGRQLVTHEQAVQLGGGERGVNLIVEMTFPAELEGVYWFDVLFMASPEDEKLLTRVPLRIVYQPQKLPLSSSS